MLRHPIDLAAHRMLSFNAREYNLWNVPAKSSFNNMVHPPGCIKPSWVPELSSLRNESITQANQKK